MIGSVASETVISILTTVRVKEGQKPFKALMLFITSCGNWTKPSLGNGRERNWCDAILQHDNARPHVSKPVKTYLETLKWKVLPYPPYSLDISPSDYYIEKRFDSWIVSKEEHFYRNGIRALLQRWAKVVANDGQYFEWFICNHFLTIKLHFHQKNSGNLIAPLIEIKFCAFKCTLLKCTRKYSTPD